jgi:hypothetical protein
MATRTLADDVERLVKLTYRTECCADYASAFIPVEEAWRVCQWIDWPTFKHEAVGELLRAMLPGTIVRIGRCEGPFLEFTKPGMQHGGIRGMFKRAICAAGNPEGLGCSRVLMQRHGYILQWNNE